jgi:hypothetical protein
MRGASRVKDITPPIFFSLESSSTSVLINVEMLYELRSFRNNTIVENGCNVNSAARWLWTAEAVVWQNRATE